MEQTKIYVKRRSPLFEASSNGHTSTEQLLLNNRADIHLCTKNGTSHLSIAYKNEDETSAQLLLRSGSDSNLSAKN